MNNSQRYLTVFQIVLIYFALHYYYIGITHSSNILENGKLPGIDTYNDLQDSSLFSFSIIGDNHGNSYMNNLYFQRMVNIVHRGKDEFVIGLGDHLKRFSTNTFLRFICTQSFWNKNFYPIVGDGENEVFGSGQDDWGAGRILLQMLDIPNRPNVHIHPNGVDYYAIITVKNYTVHFIGLHYPDEPSDPDLAFREESKFFLDSILKRIPNQKNRLVIAAAHSQYGSWVEYLSKEQYKNVMEKCDLVLAGSVHYFEHRLKNDYKLDGSLLLSNGSISDPAFKSNPGFIQVHVLNNDKGLVIEYVDLGKSQRYLAPFPQSFFKSLKGSILLLNYKDGPRDIFF